MSIQRSRVARVALLLVLAGAVGACTAGRTQAKAPASTATARSAPQAAHGPSDAAVAPNPSTNSPKAQGEDVARPQNSDGSDVDDAELVVGRDLVARCPTLRLLRQHIAEFDPDTIWLAVLESIADCMSQGGAMAQQVIGVSGDEEHRHVVREVLGTRGISPTRVIAKVSQGTAECQGDMNCSKQVEITIVPP